jgi:hypothetical protein
LPVPGKAITLGPLGMLAQETNKEDASKKGADL